MGKRKGKTATKAGGGSKRGAYSSSPKEKEEVKEEKSVGDENAVEIEIENSNPEPAASGEGGAAVAIHPLLIDHVLEKIFEHIIRPNTKTLTKAESVSVVKNVQNLRLVCKQWSVIATSLFRRIRAPMISFGRMQMRRSTSPDKKMQNFLDVMKSSDLIPVQRYNIIATVFEKQNQQLMKDFMRICGPTAVELHLYCNVNHLTMEFARGIFPDLNLMRLETLEVEGEHYGHPIQTLGIVYLIEELFSAAENLQEFDFGFQSCYNGSLWWNRLGQRIFKQIPKTVKILIFDMPLTDSHLNALAERELKLEVFQFDNQCGSSSKVIRKFFETQAATLKVLNIFELGRYGSLSPAPLDFPRLDELLHLEIEKGPVLQFSFPDTFPKLISLKTRECRSKSAYEGLLSSAKKGLSLKEIYLSYHFPQTPFVIKAAQCFPNISQLHISRSEDISEVMKKVFVYFENIEELCICFFYQHQQDNYEVEVDLDSLFSGVSELDCDRIKDHHHRNFDNVNLRDVQLQPSILNLTKLKKLRVSSCHAVTDFTAHFLLLKMASLNEFHTDRCTIMMSTKYMNLLKKKVNWYVDQFQH